MLKLNDDRSELDRRSFLRKSAVVAGGVAASSLVRIPAFAGVLSTDSPVASTRSGKVRGYVDNGKMSEAFIAFARTGNPNNRQIPRWEPYTLPRRRTMVFDVPSHLEDDPRGAERRLFAKVPYVQPGT